MQNDSLHKLTLAALFSALDYILALFQFRIPSPVGHPFVDLGFNFVALGVVSGLLKMGTGYLRYLIEALVDAGLPLPKAAVTALAAFPADFATGVSMFIVVPLFFLALNKVSHQLHWNWYQQYQ